MDSVQRCSTKSLFPFPLSLPDKAAELRNPTGKEIEAQITSCKHKILEKPGLSVNPFRAVAREHGKCL